MTSATTLTLWGVLTGSIVMPLTGASREERLCAGATLMCPLLSMDPCPRLGPFCHDGGRWCLGRHGATQDLAQRGVGRSGRESVMAVGRFCRNALVHPNGSARPGFRGVGTVC